LKYLPRRLVRDAGALARFHSEVRTARQVSHPNVCRVFDIGESDGEHFLSMEYVDGEDFASLLRRIGRLPPDKAVDIARQLCAGLSAAHSVGVLHRDLKPANVMLDGRGVSASRTSAWRSTRRGPPMLRRLRERPPTCPPSRRQRTA
jgi:serine/threonine-protein kinase